MRRDATFCVSDPNDGGFTGKRNRAGSRRKILRLYKIYY